MILLLLLFLRFFIALTNTIMDHMATVAGQNIRQFDADWRLHQYFDAQSFDVLSDADTLTIKTELAPLSLPDEDEASAVRFDALMYGIKLAYLIGGGKYTRVRNDLCKRVITGVANIPEIRVQSELIN